MSNIFTQDLSVHTKSFLKILNIIEIFVLLALSYYYSMTGDYPQLNTIFYRIFPAIFLIAYLNTSMRNMSRGYSNDELNKNLAESYEFLKTDTFLVAFKSFIYVFYPIIATLFTGLFIGRDGYAGGFMFALFSFRLTIPFLFIVSFLADKYTTTAQIKFYFVMCLVLFLISPTDSNGTFSEITGYIPYLYCLLMPYINSFRVRRKAITV